MNLNLSNMTSKYMLEIEIHLGRAWEQVNPALWHSDTVRP